VTLERGRARLGVAGDRLGVFRCVVLGWAGGRRAAGDCAGHGRRLCVGRDERHHSGHRARVLGEARTWEVGTGDVSLQSGQGQRACAGCAQRLEKDRGKTSALQEEKAELQEVGALLAFPRARGRAGGTPGGSTFLAGG